MNSVALTCPPPATVIPHLSLVRQVAGKIARRLPSHVSLEDLISAGTEGLVDAARKFDPARGVEFGAYAQIRIRGAVMDELRGNDFVPRSLRGRHRVVEQAIRSARRAGTSTSDRAISARLGLETDDVAAWASEANTSMISFDDPNTSEMGDGAALADETMEGKQQLHHLRAAMGRLPERLQAVLSMYYVEDMNLRQIGEVLGVTESRVCQLRSLAIKLLRADVDQSMGLGALSMAATSQVSSQ